MWGSSEWGSSEWGGTRTAEVVPPVFESTPPTIEPVIVTMFGTVGVAEAFSPADNLYVSPDTYGSVVIDINTPHIPKSGNY